MRDALWASVECFLGDAVALGASRGARWLLCGEAVVLADDFAAEAVEMCIRDR